MLLVPTQLWAMLLLVPGQCCSCLGNVACACPTSLLMVFPRESPSACLPLLHLSVAQFPDPPVKSDQESAYGRWAPWVALPVPQVAWAVGLDPIVCAPRVNNHKISSYQPVRIRIGGSPMQPFPIRERVQAVESESSQLSLSSA